MVAGTTGSAMNSITKTEVTAGSQSERKPPLDRVATVPDLTANSLPMLIALRTLLIEYITPIRY